MGRLDGKVALISGGSRGQGEAQARLFAREGAAVVIGDVLEQDGQRLAESIIDAGGQAAFLRLDVTAESDWAAIVQRARDEFGRLDILINNAGILRNQPIEHLSVDEYREVIEVNQVGVFLGFARSLRRCERPAAG